MQVKDNLTEFSFSNKITLVNIESNSVSGPSNLAFVPDHDNSQVPLQYCNAC